MLVRALCFQLLKRNHPATTQGYWVVSAAVLEVMKNFSGVVIFAVILGVLSREPKSLYPMTCDRPKRHHFTNIIPAAFGSKLGGKMVGHG